MREPEPSLVKIAGDKIRLARSILNAARQAEHLGFGEAAFLLRQAQAVAERAAEAGRAGSMN